MLTSRQVTDKPLIDQYFSTIAEPAAEVNRRALSNTSAKGIWAWPPSAMIRDLVSSAKIRSPAHSAGAGWKVRALAAAIGVSGKSRKLRLQMCLPTGRTSHGIA